tara:strand:- start:2660 stop:3226 length:567 start_codon:yes stop_codon:yes gene_type:complete
MPSLPKTKTAKKKSAPKRQSVAKSTPSTKKTPRAKTGANGRPTDYRPEYAEQAYKLCLLGYIDAELAEFFQVSIPTLHNWRKRYPEFLNATRLGKFIADAKVAHSLYNRAIGTTVEEWRETVCSDGQIIALKTTKQIPGDVQAQRFWLKNRQPELWNENIAITDGEGNGFQLIIHEALRPPTRPPEER